MLHMATSATEQLQQLRPTTKTNVIDLLRQVGHDVSDWSTKADGDARRNTRRQPKLLL